MDLTQTSWHPNRRLPAGAGTRDRYCGVLLPRLHGVAWCGGKIFDSHQRHKSGMHHSRHGRTATNSNRVVLKCNIRTDICSIEFYL